MAVQILIFEPSMAGLKEIVIEITLQLFKYDKASNKITAIILFTF